MTTARKLLLAVLGAAAVAMVAGCASGPDKPKPTPLESFTPQMGGRVAWNSKIDGVQFPLLVAVSPGVFTVAGNDGTVSTEAIPAHGESWSATLRLPPLATLWLTPA